MREMKHSRRYWTLLGPLEPKYKALDSNLRSDGVCSLSAFARLHNDRLQCCAWGHAAVAGGKVEAGRRQLMLSAVRRKPMAAGLTLKREARAATSETVAAVRLTIEVGMSRFAANSLAARSARQS